MPMVVDLHQHHLLSIEMYILISIFLGKVAFSINMKPYIFNHIFNHPPTMFQMVSLVKSPNIQTVITFYGRHNFI